MKVLKKSMLLLLMVLAVTVSSCSKSDDGPSGGGDSPGILTALINGENYRSLPEEAEAMVATSEGVTVLSLAGRDALGREVGVSVSQFAGVGSYNLLDPDSPEGYVGLGMIIEGEGDNTQIWMLPFEGSQIGKLIVTEYTPNQRIKGTFHFEVYNPFNESIKRVTNGSFDVRAASGSR